ncbi:MAG: HPF/RaiA family ribosome-associated protein [Anaerolineales bacterium]
MPEYRDFPVEFRAEGMQTDAQKADLYDYAEKELRNLAKGHTDITAANIDIKLPAEGRETNYIYEATVKLDVRPDNIVATEKEPNAYQALKGALKAAGRQVRDKRGRLREDRGSINDLFVAPGDDLDLE